MKMRTTKVVPRMTLTPYTVQLLKLRSWFGSDRGKRLVENTRGDMLLLGLGRQPLLLLIRSS
jgi:hypothetical protein